jgi:hypothetical protein
MDYMAATYPSTWIGVMVHNAGPLTDTYYDASISSTAIGVPSGHVDRAPMSIDPTQYEANYANRVALLPPADISVTYVINSDTVDITVIADFAADVNADYRLNCVVTENGIQDNSYNQVNFYAFGNDPLVGYGHDWSSLPDPVSGSELIYNYVARGILGEWDGEVGSVPNSIVSGDQVSYTWSYIIPVGSNVDNMDFIGMLMDNSTGEILNAGKTSTNVSLNEETNHFDVQIYPNPFTSSTKIALELNESSEVNVEVYNTAGQLVQDKNYGTLNGKVVLGLNGDNLEFGIYFVKVSVNGHVITKKVTLTK